jgi:DNA-binding IclR family transcriptional regulator
MSGREPPERAQRAVQSVEVGGRLLLALGTSAGPMTLKDLAEAAGMPASRAHPYLVSFGRLGLVAQDPPSGRYALGSAALQIGLTALHQLDPVRAAEPVAQALAERTGLAAALALWGNFGPTIVRMFEARQPLHVAMRAGTVMSVLGTATGRAFAAVLPPERIARTLALALGDPPQAAAPLLRGRADALRAARDELKAHGVARAVGHPIPGVNAFSAPAFDHEGAPAIVITVLGHQDDLDPGWGSPGAQAVREAAAAVSRRLGARPAAPG